MYLVIKILSISEKHFVLRMKVQTTILKVRIDGKLKELDFENISKFIFFPNEVDFTKF